MRHLLRRVGFYLAALWASATINFLIPRLMPGDPVQAYLGRMEGHGSISASALQALRVEFGISDAPLWIQYFQYLGNLLHGNLGVSIPSFKPVTEILAYDLQWTLALVGVATVISFVLGTMLGVIVSWKRGSWLDTIAPPLLTFFSAVPYFWMALGLVYIFGFVLSWLPIGGGFDTLNPDLEIGWNWDYIFSVLQHAFLPALTIVVGSMAGWVLSMRNTMITTLSEDYVLMAQAKGLSEKRVMFAYAARNAILPSITGFAMSLGFVVGGALLTEIVFSYPGIGFDLFNAVLNVDYSLIEGTFLVIAIAMLAANFLADVVYTILDPRVRQERA